ncbi:MAG: DUF5301 domain-containing protein [Lachnospiraceae bacterium]
MKNKLVIYVVLLFVTILFLIGCGKNMEKDMLIENEEQIISISVISLEGKEIQYSEIDTINEIVEILNTSKITNKESIQDVPTKNSYGKIHLLMKDTEEIVYYYFENNNTYLEKPYVGIYCIDGNIEDGLLTLE